MSTLLLVDMSKKEIENVLHFSHFVTQFFFLHHHCCADSFVLIILHVLVVYPWLLSNANITSNMITKNLTRLICYDMSLFA